MPSEVNFGDGPAVATARDAKAFGKARCRCSLTELSAATWSRLASAAWLSGWQRQPCAAPGHQQMASGTRTRTRTRAEQAQASPHETERSLLNCCPLRFEVGLSSRWGCNLCRIAFISARRVGQHIHNRGRFSCRPWLLIPNWRIKAEPGQCHREWRTSSETSQTA